jgi:hypothetical protein
MSVGRSGEDPGMETGDGTVASLAYALREEAARWSDHETLDVRI